MRGASGRCSLTWTTKEWLGSGTAAELFLECIDGIATAVCVQRTCVVVQVWQRLQAEVLRRYVQLEEQMALCYPSMQLTPSPQELEELCKSVALS